MEINNIVIVSLTSPKEKMWGQILLLETQGELRAIATRTSDSPH